MSFLLITPPAIEPLTAAEIRTRLNIGTEVVDEALNALIATARLKIERRYDIAMITQTWDYILDMFPQSSYNNNETGFYSSYFYNFDNNMRQSFRVGQGDIRLPISPIQSISSITYLDSAGVSQTLDPATYVFNNGDLQSRLSQALNVSWPTTQFTSRSVKVRIVAGYGSTADTVPQMFKTVIALLVNHLRSLLQQNIFLSSQSVTGVGEERFMVGKAGTDVIDQAVDALMMDYVRPSL